MTFYIPKWSEFQAGSDAIHLRTFTDTPGTIWVVLLYKHCMSWTYNVFMSCLHVFCCCEILLIFVVKHCMSMHKSLSRPLFGRHMRLNPNQFFRLFSCAISYHLNNNFPTLTQNCPKYTVFPLVVQFVTFARKSSRTTLSGVVRRSSCKSSSHF